MTNRACARPSLKSHTPIRFVSGVEAANWAEPDGNQVTAITRKGPKTPAHLQLRFQAKRRSVSFATQGVAQGATNGTACAVQSMRLTSH
jgi:hypothetical protein